MTLRNLASRSLCAALIGVGLSCHALAADHVLIMTISEYPNLGAPLPGAALDGKNALALAAKLGYRTTGANVKVLKESALSGDGIQRAVSSVASSIAQGDRLFLYFSGHGSSYPAQEGCAEALVPYDAGLESVSYVRTSELIRALDGARDRLSDAFIFFDACHSGGLREVVVGAARSSTSRGANDAPKLRAKSVPGRGGEQCLAVANKSSMENYSKDAKSRGLANSVKRNFTFVAAARENEEALDSEGGGMATTAMLECANKGVGNTSGTGVVSVDELRACAQQIINTKVPSISKTHRPHHIEVHGNTAKMLASVAAMPSGGQTAPMTDADRVVAAFNQVAANSNPNLGFSASLTDTSVPLGSRVSLSYRSAVPGFMSVLYVGSDRTHIMPLLDSRPVAPSAGEVVGPTTITGPVGLNQMLVLLTREPLNVKTILESAKRGEKVSLSGSIAQNIACLGNQQRNLTTFEVTAASGESGCRTRNLTEIGSPTTSQGSQPNYVGYGAQLLDVTGR